MADKNIENPKKPKKEKLARRSVEKSTTVRVTNSTREKLNLLVEAGVGKTIDQVLNVLIDKYIANKLSPTEMEQMELLMSLHKKRDKKSQRR